MKLKQLLEGYAWERKADGSLPTLEDATAKHQSNLNEMEYQSDDTVHDAFMITLRGYQDAIKRFKLDMDQVQALHDQLGDYFKV